MDELRKWLFALLLLPCLAWAVNPIDINTADAQALAEAMKGIGPTKAQAIVDYRDQHGPFTSVEDLAKVKGIGEHTVQLNRAVLTVNNTQ